MGIFPKGTYAQLTGMKRYSKSLVIREIQIKTAMRYHLTPDRIAKINNRRYNRCWEGCGKGDPLDLLVGVQTGTATVESSPKS